MLPEERFNLVAGLESRHDFIHNTVATYLGEDIDNDQRNGNRSLVWNVHLSPEGAVRILFNQPDGSSMAPSPEITLGDLPPQLQLPAELQLRVVDFCSDDRTTLLRLRQTSFLLRAEATKIIFSDPHTYYSVDASWLLTGGHPGRTDYSMSFLPLVQNIEIDYGVDAESIVSPRGDPWWFPQIRDGVMKNSWKVLKKRFPSVKRVVLYQTSARHSLYPGNMSPWLRCLLEACPPGIDATVFCAVAQGSPVLRRGAIQRNGTGIQIERSLYRLSNNGELKTVAPRRPYQTVLIPSRAFNGPVGQFERVKYLDESIESKRRGIGLTMIEALDRYFDNVNGLSMCPMRSCYQRFTQIGQWPLHAVLEHVNQLVPGSRFERWPSELTQEFARRNVELLQLKQRNDLSMKRMHQEWDEATEDERAKIKEAWMEQLRTDPNWDTGVPAEDSPLWKRFESWMRERKKARIISEAPRRQENGECAPSCPCRWRKTPWTRFTGWMQSWWYWK